MLKFPSQPLAPYCKCFIKLFPLNQLERGWTESIAWEERS